MNWEESGDPIAAEDAATTALLNALGEIAGQVVRLKNAGAHQFLYMLVPPIQKTPAIKSLDAVLAAMGLSNPDDVINLADSLTLFFNFFPGLGLTTVFATIPGIDHTPLDVHTLTLQIVAAPGDFGLENVTDACITPFNAPWKCKNPDEYLFWDGIHPTEAAHAIIAEKAAFVLASP